MEAQRLLISISKTTLKKFMVEFDKEGKPIFHVWMGLCTESGREVTEKFIYSSAYSPEDKIEVSESAEMMARALASAMQEAGNLCITKVAALLDNPVA